jgi:Tol biopolymer transport system component
MLIRKLPLALALAFAGALAYAQGGPASLTVSRVDLPVSVDDRPFCVTLPKDGRMIAFQSERAGGQGKQDIWISRWEGGRWSAPQNAGPGVNTAVNEVDAKFSADGKTMIFIRGENFRTASQIFISQWKDGKWSEAKWIGAAASPADTIEFGAVLSSDGKRIYFASNRSGGHGGFDLYYSELHDEQWAEPVNLGPVVNTAENEVDVALSPDGKTIVFPAKRPDSIGGSTDLYISRFANGAWSPIENLGPRINTPATDTCPWLAFDGNSLYVNTEWDGLVQGKKAALWVWKFEHSGGF